MSGIPSTGNLIEVYSLQTGLDAGASAQPIAPFGISWRTEKNGTGTGTFTLPLDDPAFPNIYINDVAAIRRNGTTAAAMVIEQIQEHTLDIEGRGAQVATYTGRLIGSVLEWALIFPALGVQRKPIEDDAVFDWRSLRYDPSLEAWAAANEIMTVAAAEAGAWPHQPMAASFDLTTGAKMILDSSGSDLYAPMGWYLFRRTFTVTIPGRYGIESLMDDKGIFWVDGIQQLDVPDTDGFVRASFKRLELSAGQHLFTWAVYNKEDPAHPGLGLGPAALAYNFYKSDLQDHPLGAVVAVSDASTQVLYMGELAWPGMTVGQILLDLLAEAQTGYRGYGLDWLVPTFDAVNDSNGDPWPRIPGITTKTGTTTLLTFMSELVASYRVAQWRIRPDGVTWDVFTTGYTHTVAVSLQPATVTDPLTGQLLQLDRKIT